MIGIIKTSDKRYDYLCDLITEDYIYSNQLSDFKDIDILVLPLLGIDRFMFIKDTSINLLDFVAKFKLKRIICGMKNEHLIDLCHKECIELISYLDFPSYTWINSKLSAEGLLKKILNDTNDSIIENKILILGYGYMGKALYKYFSPLVNNISIYAKDYHDIKQLFCDGINISKLDDLANYDIIINTINYPIIDRDKLSTIKNDTKLYDVSSYPYGFDLDACLDMNYHVDIVAKIPALYMPKTAALYIYRTISNYLNKYC